MYGEIPTLRHNIRVETNVTKRCRHECRGTGPSPARSLSGPHNLRHGIGFRLSALISSRRGRCDSARLIRRIRSFSHDPSYQHIPTYRLPVVGLSSRKRSAPADSGYFPFPICNPRIPRLGGPIPGLGLFTPYAQLGRASI